MKIPKIIEGQDFFDDQSFFGSFLEKEPEPNEQHQKLVEEVYQTLISKGLERRDVSDIVFCKFGVALESMSGMALLEVKEWVARLEARPVKNEEEL